MTLNAMHPDILVVRHHSSGAVALLRQKVDGSVINAGRRRARASDAGAARRAHHPPQQGQHREPHRHDLRRHSCIRASRARTSSCSIRSGARVRVVAPSTLLPPGIERFGVEVSRDMREGLKGADIVMMLRLQRERMNGSFVPSTQEYFHYYGLDQKKLSYAKPDALVMHPGPMNRGVEIDSAVADGAQSLIREQVEMGVAVRMAVLEALSRNLPNA
jgi:aspartate carbamoyltransferase catalytic subunit